MIKISPFTPLFFSPSSDEFGAESKYVQLFSTEDNILIQVFASPECNVEGHLKNHVDGSIQDIRFQSFSLKDGTTVCYSTIAGLVPGYYSVTVEGQECNVFKVTGDKSELSKTTLIRYSMRDNKQRNDCVFWNGEEQFYFEFRAPGGFKDDDWTFTVNNEQFEVSNGNIVELFAIESTQKKFTLGNAEGCPVWFAEHLNRILCCSNVYFNGVRFVRKGNSVPEMTQEVPSLKSYIFKVSLQAMVDNIDIDFPDEGGNEGEESEGGGAGSVYLIRLNDTTVPTDKNTFSAIRILAEIKDALKNGEKELLEKINEAFFHKDRPDSTDYLVGFNAGITLGAGKKPLHDIIRSVDNAIPSDTSVYSSLSIDTMISGLEDKYIHKDKPDSTLYEVDFTAGLMINSKRIGDVIRYYDDSKPVATDANIYSALQTDQRIEEELVCIEDKYIHKDRPDSTDHLTGFNVGITLSFDKKPLHDIIRSVDNAIPSETSVYSSLSVDTMIAGLEDKYIHKDKPDSTLYEVDFQGGLLINSKRIGDVIRYYDATKPVATDANIYSALQTDQRIEEELDLLEDKYIRKDQPDSTLYPVDFTAGLLINSKRIGDVIRYYDDPKPVATDANIYSALQTDQRIEEEFGKIDDRYIRKDKEDVAHKEITFEEGITVYELAKLMNLDVKQLATIAKAVCAVVRSSKFVDGFAGEGYQIWQDIASGDWCMTLDRLTVRKVLTIYEMAIAKIRSAGGMIVVSAANGIIKSAEKIGSQYVIEFDDVNQFVPGDLMRCQVFSPSGLKYYWVRVSAVNGEKVYVPVSEFEGVEPAKGDEVVLMGNTDNPLRQNLLLISATEDGQPRFDCLDGVKTKNLNGCLKVRVGALDGISDSRFPADMQPSGYGIYGNNCFLTGVFVLSNGKDVMTMFSIMEGMIKSEISSVRNEINAKDNYLDNAAFADNMSGWSGTSNIRIFRVDGRLLYFNSNFYANKQAFAGITVNGTKSVLRLKNSSITQRNADFARHPEFDLYDVVETDEEGNEIVTGQQYRARMFYVSFRYKVTRPGTLRVYFKGESPEGFEEYAPVDYTEVLNPTEEFKVMEIAGKWNGTGDFYLSFSGDMYLYSLALADNRLADVEEKFTMRFDATDKKIQANLDEIKKTGTKLEEYHSEFLLTARNLQLQFSEDLSNAERRITSAYKSYVNLTARDLTAQFSADLSDAESRITEAYTSAIELSARGLRADFTADLTDMEEGITSAYKSYVNLTAQNLQAGFTEDLADLRTGVTEAYTSAIELSARGLRTEFSSSITDINGRLTTHEASFHVTSSKIEAMVSATDSINDTIRTAGWITTADGNKLWATKTTVNGIGDRLTTHEASFHVTAAKIEGIVADITEQGTNYSKLTQTVSGITADVSDISGKYASLKVQVDAIGAVVGDGTDGSFSEFQQTINSLTTQVADNKTAAAGALSAAQDAATAAAAAQGKADSAYDKALSNATAIVQTNAAISAIAGYFDAEGHLIEGAGWVTTAQGNTLWAKSTTVDEINGRLTTHEASFHVTAAKIEAMVSATDTINDTIRTAGWITTADGNKLWATKTTVNGIGDRLTTHEASFHVTAAKIEAMVSATDSISDTIRTAGWITTADGNKLWAAQTDLSKEADNARILAAVGSGKALYDNPTFLEVAGNTFKSRNSISVYNNAGGNAATITRKSISGVPNDTGFGLEIATSASGGVTPGLGGFFFGTATKANRMMVCKFVAKVPSGYTVEFATNATGDGGVKKWLTAHVGTGNWEEYAYYVRCGSSGSFSSTFFFYLSGGSRPVTWQLASANVYELSAQDLASRYSQIKQTVDSISFEIYGEEGKFSILKQTVDTLSSFIGDGAEGDFSQIIQRIDSIQTKVNKIVLDDEGNVTNVSTAGITTDANGNYLFATKTEYNNQGTQIAAIQSSLNLTAGRVDAIAARFDAEGHLIEGAGWVTTALGNTLWAAKSTEKRALDAAKAAADAASAVADAMTKANGAYDKAGENATAIVQTNAAISTIAGYFDSEGHLIEGAGWVTTAQGNKLWAKGTTVDAINGRLTTHEASFHVTAAKIEAMVSATDTINDTIRTAGWITTADGNKLWAKSTTVDEINGRLTTHEASFHVTSSKIEAMVSATDTINDTIRTAGWITTADGNKLWATKTTVNGIGDRLTTHEASFHVTAAKIEGIVADITEQGTNYSKLTQTVSGITADVSDISGKYASLKVQVDAIGAVVGDGTDGSFSEFQQTINSLTTQVADNKTAAAGALSAAQDAASAAAAAQGKADSAYSKALSNATAIVQTNAAISAIAGYFDANGKLIEGAGWLTTANAASIYATKTTVNSLGERVTAAESRITANADSISMTVRKDGIISAINQTAESVTIDASKINLAGAVTVKALAADVKQVLDGKASSSGLGAMAYKDAVELAQLGESIIEGGYIKTSLINADLIVAKKLQTSTAKYNISLDNDGLVCDSYQNRQLFSLSAEYVSATAEGVLELGSILYADFYKVRISSQGIRFYKNGNLTKTYASE